MPNREQELHDLEQADHHIGLAHARVARQRELVAELARDGHDTGRAAALLETMEAVLATFEAHRETILRALASTAPPFVAPDPADPADTPPEPRR